MVDLSQIKEIQIFTIGTNGRSIENFINTLKQNYIQIVVDIRRVRFNRWVKAYNESNLRKSLEYEEIAYEVCEDLAPQAALRTILHEEKTRKNYHAWKHFLHAFDDQIHILNPYKNGSKLIHILSHSNRIALMCTEKHHLDCHRTLVAKSICQNIPNCTITHLMTQDVKRDVFKSACDQKELLCKE